MAEGCCPELVEGGRGGFCEGGRCLSDFDAGEFGLECESWAGSTLEGGPPDKKIVNLLTL